MKKPLFIRIWNKKKNIKSLAFKMIQQLNLQNSKVKYYQNENKF